MMITCSCTPTHTHKHTVGNTGNIPPVNQLTNSRHFAASDYPATVAQSMHGEKKRTVSKTKKRKDEAVV